MADAWLADYEAAKQTAAETLQLIQVPPAAAAALGMEPRLPRSPCRSCSRWPPPAQSAPCALPLHRSQERNLKFPEGGPEARRLTATARRKLGTLGSLLDALRASLEGPEHTAL